MNELKHTPGPWAWRRFGDTYTLHADHGGGETIIGAIPHGEMKYPVVAMSIEGRLSDVDPDHPNAKLLKAAPDLLKAAEAAIAYDNAIYACANDTDKMYSFCTAEGKDLDALYEDWIYKSKEAIKKATE